jgi:hypothetical protein
MTKYVIRDNLTRRFVKHFDGRSPDAGRLDTLAWARRVPLPRGKKIVNALNGFAGYNRFVLVPKDFCQLFSAKLFTHLSNSRPIF